MFVLEFKAKVKLAQRIAIDEAIRTAQFVRNKCLRYWMDNRGGIGKYDLYKHNTKLRSEFEFVKNLNSHACQAAVERTWSSISRFYENCRKSPRAERSPRTSESPEVTDGDVSPRTAEMPSGADGIASSLDKGGNTGGMGYPRFKKHSRSVEYKTSGWSLSENRRWIKFTDKKNIGALKLIGTRDLNYYQVEQIKRVRIIRRADGYYVQMVLSLDPRDTVKPHPVTNRAIGIDVGLKYFYADCEGNTVAMPNYYRVAERQLNRANRKKSVKYRRGQPQSANYHRARKRYARKHLRVSRQREEYCKANAYSVIQSNDLIAYEDLNVRGLVKNRHLAKSITDAGWSTFRRWLEYFGYKYGKITVAVPPHNTSQNCSNCGKKVQKSLSTRTHVCPHCNYVADRDVNAARNILQRALTTAGHVGSLGTCSGVLPERNVPYTLGESFPLVFLEQS